MEDVKEQGGLPDAPLDGIACALREAAVAQTKQALLTLVSSIDGKNAGHCLSMISSYCKSMLDTLTALVPELAAAPKKKRMGSINISSSGAAQPYVSVGNADFGEAVGTMMGNETFGASILTQAMSAIGPMIQSQEAKALTAALANAKDAKLGAEITSVLESSLKSALGVAESAPVGAPPFGEDITPEVVGSLPYEEG